MFRIFLLKLCFVFKFIYHIALFFILFYLLFTIFTRLFYLVLFLMLGPRPKLMAHHSYFCRLIASPGMRPRQVCIQPIIAANSRPKTDPNHQAESPIASPTFHQACFLLTAYMLAQTIAPGSLSLSSSREAHYTTDSLYSMHKRVASRPSTAPTSCING